MATTSERRRLSSDGTQALHRMTVSHTGQQPEVKQGEEVLGQVGIHAAEHFLPIIQPYLYGLIQGVPSL